MNKFFSILFFGLVIGIGIFQYSRNLDVDVNYERFNLVAPGILRTPEKHFKDLKEYPNLIYTLVLMYRDVIFC